MKDVEFDEEESLNSLHPRDSSATSSGLTGLIIKAKFAKDTKGASFFLFFTAIIVSFIAIAVFLSANSA